MLTRKKIVMTLLCLVVFAAAFFVWQKNKKSADSLTKQKPPVDETVAPTTKTYADQDLGFSFDYPDNFNLQQSAGDAGAMITVQGEDGKNGFQITVAPYAEKTDLSLATIKNDAGALTMMDGREISIGQKNGVQAFSFTLTNPDADPSDVSAKLDEVWFVRNGQLYQISNYADFAGNMGKILQSLRFN